MKPSPALKETLLLIAAEELEKEATRLLAKATGLVRKAREAYAKARPLTEKEHAELIDHVRAGGALCCTKGCKWLLERLPRPWALEINAWAYENTSCHSNANEEELAERVERVRRLKLDRFPKGYHSDVE